MVEAKQKIKATRIVDIDSAGFPMDAPLFMILISKDRKRVAGPWQIKYNKER